MLGCDAVSQREEEGLTGMSERAASPGDNPYAGLNVLIHWHGPPGPPRCAPRQVIVGPFYADAQTADGVASLNVPFGSYDIRSVVDRLPAHQRPDVLIVAIDASKSSIPTNLAALDCPKALVVGDTHHLEAPIRFVFGYLLAEKFDVLIGDYTRQHLHFFWHAGRARLAWIPGMWVPNYDIPFREDRPDRAVFVGRVTHHVYRRQVIAAIGAAGLPLEVVSGIGADEAARRYSRATATLNCSLNGDVNMRVFEALGHGGFLLTDRLAPEAGLSTIFAEGEELAFYDDAEDAVAKLRFYLERPAAALAMARRGFAAYRSRHRRELKMLQLLSTVLDDGRYALPPWRDARAEPPGPGEPQGLLARILVYECLQELHRTAGSLAVTASAGVDARTLSDMLDLPRLRCTRLQPTADATAATLARLGYAGRVSAGAAASHADVLIATVTEIENGRAGAALRAAPVPRILLTEADAAGLDRVTPLLLAAGYRPSGREPPLFERAT